ncbi:hypothetical protein PBY51_016143 [Eleginops maclovinus]|uniref:Interleukin-4 n=1 Tax=Eleginops maclovinus TaxID=56733 RepID=A0AAN8AM16_ELEMC|nr:hypothetical protein PBY51_016143 [Eleginops maclovinus]
MKNFNTQYLMVLMMIEMVYSAPHSKNLMKQIREETVNLLESKNMILHMFVPMTTITDCPRNVFCLAEKALKMPNNTEFLNFTDKLARQLSQYNQNHSFPCTLNTNEKIKLVKLLKDLKDCADKMCNLQ